VDLAKLTGNLKFMVTLKNVNACAHMHHLMAFLPGRSVKMIVRICFVLGVESNAVRGTARAY